MSKVPPSPAHVITVVSLSPFMSRAARTPLAVAPPVSKAVWITGIFRLDWGNGPAITDQQQAGRTMMVFSPKAFSTNRMAIVAPQPGQPTWPEHINSLSRASSCTVHLLEPHPDTFFPGGVASFYVKIDFFQ